MRVSRRGTRRATLSSSRLSGTERAWRRCPREKIISSRRSMRASSPPSASIALRAWGATGYKGLRRLLGCHLVNLAARKIEAHARDPVQIGAGDAHEAGLVGIVDRVNGAVLIDAGVPGQQSILLDGIELGLGGIAAVVLALPFRHLGVLCGLAVDGPGGAVIVRRGHARLVVDVGEDLKAQLGILVEKLEPARHMLSA